jgi:hypothetical protein
VNFLIIESLQKFHHYYGDDFRVECPTGSGRFMSIHEAANELACRLTQIFLKDAEGKRPVFAHHPRMQNDPHFRDYVLFYEYFHGDSGRGVGASHQTGWTGLVAKLLMPRYATPTFESPLEEKHDGRSRSLRTPSRTRHAARAAAETAARAESPGHRRQLRNR